MVEPNPLRMQQVIDIVSGAIDAWFSTDVRHATEASSVEPSGGGPMTLRFLTACDRNQPRYTARDGLIGAGVMSPQR
jgi:hypothetical protein